MKTRRTPPQINSGTLADVAFLLLIFFMVATTLQRDKSISMKLPPSHEETTAQRVHEDKVLTILINSDNYIMIENEQVQKNIASTISNHLIGMVSNKIKPIINVKMHPEASYQAYLSVLSDVKKSVRNTKENLSQEIYASPLEQLTRDQYLSLSRRCGIKIMEREVIL